jgi:apolipoprotein N-acyltransferase
VIAALLAIAAYVLAFPPADLGPLAFVALAPWCLVARRLRGWRLFLAGSAIGLAIMTLGCWWLRKSHPLNLVLMVVPESLFFGGFALLLRAATVARGWPAIVALPVTFTTVEVVRGRWPLDGFPWLTLGYTQHGWLDLVQLSAVAGVHGVTFLLALVAGACFDALSNGDASGWKRWRGVAVAAALVAVVAIAGHASLGDPESLPKGPKLLLVQPNVPQKLKDSRTSGDELLRLHFELVDAALSAGKSDLVVWSETMLPEYLPAEGEVDRDVSPQGQRAQAQLQATLAAQYFRRHSLPLLAGAVTYVRLRAGEPRPRNSALLFDKSGRRVATYDKKVLVPGGEYIPWIDSFPDGVADSLRRLVRDMAGFPPNLESGVRPGVIDLSRVDVPGRAGLTICFEFAYPHVSRALVEEGADFLLNLSNEAWFPDSAEFEQASAMATFRAAEARRSLVRCANSGTSGWFDPWGRRHLLERDGRRDGIAGTLVVEPRIAEGRTLYVRFGEWLGIACGMATAALVTLRFPRSRSRDPSGETKRDALGPRPGKTV